MVSRSFSSCVSNSSSDAVPGCQKKLILEPPYPTYYPREMITNFALSNEQMKVLISSKPLQAASPVHQKYPGTPDARMVGLARLGHRLTLATKMQRLSTKLEGDSATKDGAWHIQFSQPLAGLPKFQIQHSTYSRAMHARLLLSPDLFGLRLFLQGGQPILCGILFEVSHAQKILIVRLQFMSVLYKISVWKM